MRSEVLELLTCGGSQAGPQPSSISVGFWFFQLYNISLLIKKKIYGGSPGSSVVKNLPTNAADTGSIPDPRGSQYHGAA